MPLHCISYYGKIPTHGDFVSHLIPRAFTSVWDDWTQENLVHCKKIFAEDWVVEYLTMSPYRFILSPGIAGEVIWCGVIFGSRDRSGRLFPFTVCVPLSPKAVSPFTLFDDCHVWLDKLEALAIQCLMPDFKKESLQSSFQDELQKIAAQWPIPIDSTSSFTCAKQTDDTEQALFGLHTDNLKFAAKDATLKNISYGLLDSVLSEFCHGYSLWWTKDKEDFVVCQGLPTKEMSTAFLDKNWRKWGWLTPNNETTTNQP